mmetsp:Transcript_913/g.2851  ORF Transcript_913/g.2851 Transcript_913/m.2851 type:complete len:159 (+) Transcript_913:3604-4080(+)
MQRTCGQHGSEHGAANFQRPYWTEDDKVDDGTSEDTQGRAERLKVASRIPRHERTKGCKPDVRRCGGGGNPTGSVSADSADVQRSKAENHGRLSMIARSLTDCNRCVTSCKRSERPTESSFHPEENRSFQSTTREMLKAMLIFKTPMIPRATARTMVS